MALLRSLRLFRFIAAAAIILTAPLAQAADSVSEAAKSASSGSIVTDMLADAERVGEKASELGGSATDIAEDAVETATERAKKAYDWTKKQGEEAHNWSKKKIQEIIQ